MRFEWANHAAEALGCEYEELNTATFKHHLRQIIEQVTCGPSRRGLVDEETSSGIAVLPLLGTPASFDLFVKDLMGSLLYADLLGAGKATVGRNGHGHGFYLHDAFDHIAVSSGREAC